MMIFSKTLTETIPSKNPKNPETIPSNVACPGKNFNNDKIFSIVEKFLKMLFNDNIFKNI